MSFLNAMSMSRRLWLLTGASLVGLVIMAASMLLEEARIIHNERQRAVQQTVDWRPSKRCVTAAPSTSG